MPRHMLLVHTDIINLHGLRKDAVINPVFSTPVSADSNIQNKMEFLVEWPRSGTRLFIFEFVVFFIVDQEQKSYVGASCFQE